MANAARPSTPNLSVGGDFNERSVFDSGPSDGGLQDHLMPWMSDQHPVADETQTSGSTEEAILADGNVKVNVKMGQMFETREDAQGALYREHAPLQRSFSVCKSDASRWEIKCANKSSACLFSMTMLLKTKETSEKGWKVSQLNAIHTCPVLPKITGYRAKVICDYLVPLIKDFSIPSVRLAREYLNEVLGISASDKVVANALKLAYQSKFGDPVSSCSLLPDLKVKFESWGSDNRLLIEKDDENRFMNAFISIGSSVKLCRRPLRILSVDYTHCWGKLKGGLYTLSILYDGRILNPCWSVSMAEDARGWMFFLRGVEATFKHTLARENVLLMSDREKGKVSPLNHALTSCTWDRTSACTVCAEGGRTPAIMALISLSETFDRQRQTLFEVKSNPGALVQCFDNTKQKSFRDCLL